MPPLALPPLDKAGDPVSLAQLTLRQKQARFVLMTAHLIAFAFSRGWELRTGDGYRDPRAFGEMGQRGPYGESKSAHKQRLAHDWMLDIDGVWQQDTAAYRELGEFWESMGGCWGGRFNDGNHFSLEHAGIK